MGDDETEDDRPFWERTKEAGATALKSGMRTVENGLRLIDPSIPTTDAPGVDMTLYSDADKAAAARHPIAGAIGQAAVMAPLALSPGGAVAGVLGEAAAGGYAAEAENAWQQDRDFSQEAAFQNTALGLLIGAGTSAVAQVAGPVVRKLGRNLFTEAEHAVNSRAARDLMGDPAVVSGDTAAEIARRGPDDEGVRYLRDNHDSLMDDLAAEHSKAAQQLHETYSKLAPLRQTPKQVAELIPDNLVDQARWVKDAEKEIGAALDELEPQQAKPLFVQLAQLADGDDPAEWFARATELSDDLLKARSKAAPSAAVEMSPIIRGTRPAEEGKIVDFYGEPEASQSHLPEAAHAAETMGAGKTIEDFGALPLEPGDTGVESLKGYQHFKDTGNVEDSFGRSSSGLPSFMMEDGRFYLDNGRHRWTAARELGVPYIQGRIRKLDAEGEELWSYIGPIRVNASKGKP